MGRQSHKALERLKKIASMGEAEAKEYLRNEKRTEPAGDSAGSLHGVVGPHAAKNRKSSRHNCPICGRWLDKRLRCAKVWSDGEGGWEHD